MKSTTLKSIFGKIENVGWLEYVTKIQKTNKENKPIKIQAFLVWRSNYRFAAPAKMSGSFASKKEAFKFLEEAIEEMGGAIIEMNQKKIETLSKEFNYPERRSQYLSNKPILIEKNI